MAAHTQPVSLPFLEIALRRPYRIRLVVKLCQLAVIEAMLKARLDANCVTLPRQGKHVSERKETSLARRRYQKGSLFLRGKRQPVWIGRWLEDVIANDGTIRRVHRSEMLGTLKELPTRRLACRELDARLELVNSPTYRARPSATFAQFASRWEATVLSQHKPSTQATIRSQLRKYLVPFFAKSDA